MSVVGALTTVFTPPSTCDANAYFEWKSDCFPYPTIGVILSPAICPIGYTVACPQPTPTLILDDGQETVVTWGGSSKKGETASVCCPMGFSCPTQASYKQHDQPVQCVSTYKNEEVWLNAIQIRWQKSDLPHLETDPTVPATVRATATTGQSSGSSGVSKSTTPTASTVSPSRAVPVSTSTAYSPDETSDPSDDIFDSDGTGNTYISAVYLTSPDDTSLSTPAKAGIAISSTFAALALLALCLLFLRRRRRHSGKKTEKGSQADGEVDLSALTPSSDIKSPPSPAALPLAAESFLPIQRHDPAPTAPTVARPTTHLYELPSPVPPTGRDSLLPSALQIHDRGSRGPRVSEMSAAPSSGENSLPQQQRAEVEAEMATRWARGRKWGEHVSIDAVVTGEGRPGGE